MAYCDFEGTLFRQDDQTGAILGPWVDPANRFGLMRITQSTRPKSSGPCVPKLLPTAAVTTPPTGPAPAPAFPAAAFTLGAVAIAFLALLVMRR